MVKDAPRLKLLVLLLIAALWAWGIVQYNREPVEPQRNLIFRIDPEPSHKGELGKPYRMKV